MATVSGQAAGSDPGPATDSGKVPAMVKAPAHAAQMGAAQAEQGRRKRVYVRIPASEPETWAMLGMEVEKWVAEGIVDGLVSCATLWPRPIWKH